MAVWLMPDRRRIRALRLSEAVARSTNAMRTSRGRASQSRRERVIREESERLERALALSEAQSASS
jgi:hypothetical protein